MEAEIVVAADNPPVNARCTPDEKKGSIWIQTLSSVTASVVQLTKAKDTN
jgi:hypothetical protein